MDKKKTKKKQVQKQDSADTAIKVLGNNQELRALGVRSSQHHFEIRSSPLPSPKELGAYEKIKLGFADRIIKIIENQAANRIYMNEKGMKLSFTGVFLAFLFICLVLGIILISLFIFKEQISISNKAIYFIGIIGLSSAFIVRIFIYGTKSFKKIEGSEKENNQNIFPKK